MAIKFQFNKTSPNELNKQLRIREFATLKNKESALRFEVKLPNSVQNNFGWVGRLS